MTTSTDPTNTPDDCVPQCVPDCVPDPARAPGETSASPSPSSSMGDALSEPSAPRPHDCVPGTSGEGAEPHGSGVARATPWLVEIPTDGWLLAPSTVFGLVRRLEAAERDRDEARAHAAAEAAEYEAMVVQRNEQQARADAARARAAAAESALAAVKALADDLSSEIDELRDNLPPKGPSRVAHIYRTAGLSEARDRLRAALTTPTTPGTGSDQ